jgi:hypothetical protein
MEVTFRHRKVSVWQATDIAESRRLRRHRAINWWGTRKNSSTREGFCPEAAEAGRYDLCGACSQARYRGEMRKPSPQLPLSRHSSTRFFQSDRRGVGVRRKTPWELRLRVRTRVRHSTTHSLRAASVTNFPDLLDSVLKFTTDPRPGMAMMYCAHSAERDIDHARALDGAG